VAEEGEDPRVVRGRGQGGAVRGGPRGGPRRPSRGAGGRSGEEGGGREGEDRAYGTGSRTAPAVRRLKAWDGLSPEREPDAPRGPEPQVDAAVRLVDLADRVHRRAAVLLDALLEEFLEERRKQVRRPLVYAARGPLDRRGVGIQELDLEIRGLEQAGVKRPPDLDRLEDLGGRSREIHRGGARGLCGQRPVGKDCLEPLGVAGVPRRK